MEEKDSNPRVIDDTEKRDEEIERLQKRVEELEKNGDALQERLEDVEREKSWISRRAAIDKEQLDVITGKLEKEKKRGEESDVAHKERETALDGENKVLRREVVGLKEENGILKEEMTEVKRTLDECDNDKRRLERENEELKRRLKEMEDEKLSNAKETGEISTQTEEKSANLVPKEEKIDEYQSTPHDNLMLGLDFKEEDLKLEEGLMYNGDMNEIDQLYGNGPLDDLSTAFNSQFKEESMDHSFTNPYNQLGDELDFNGEETPNYYENSGLGDLNMAMHNSLIDQSFYNDASDLRNISNGDDPILGDKNSFNDFPSGIDEGIEQSQGSQVADQISGSNILANRIDQSEVAEDSLETGENEAKRRPSRNSSKHVKYNESMEDSDDDGGPSLKKSKLECGKKSEQKTVSCPKKDPSESSRKAKCKMSDTEMKCPECEFSTRSANSMVAHLKRKHNTSLVLAGLALLCECGNESYSIGPNAHNYKCDIANFTVIRKRDGPIQRLNDEKMTPQCILCEEYPKTAGGYATHLRKHHNSTLNENGIFLLCSCGVKVHSSHGEIHNKDCNPRQFSLHEEDQK